MTEGDICALLMLLNKHVKQANKDGFTSVNTMRMSKKLKTKLNTNGTIKECYMYMNSHYFTGREAISFNPDGFIGFAGWADNGNKKPIIEAFIEWVDELAS